ERLAVLKQPLPRLDDLGRSKGAYAGVVELAGAVGCFAGGALEDAGGEAARRERAHRGPGHPLFRQLAPGDEREREAVDREAVPVGQLERQGDARLDGRT